MNEMNMAFTAVFLELNANTSFIEELPAMNAHGRERRRGLLLYELAAEVFDDERRNVDVIFAAKPSSRR